MPGDAFDVGAEFPHLLAAADQLTMSVGAVVIDYGPDLLRPRTLRHTLGKIPDRRLIRAVVLTGAMRVHGGGDKLAIGGDRF